ncbi:MAG: hypothetical protein IPN95_26565 [Bacteroidetes bacterium]|nr:hypothetical protein [Bacteroidota bacterium]
MRTTLDVSATIRRLRELKEITRESMAAELNLSLSGYSKMDVEKPTSHSQNCIVLLKFLMVTLPRY